MRLTDLGVRTLKYQGKPEKFFDDAFPQFGVRVYKSGKSFKISKALSTFLQQVHSTFSAHSGLLHPFYLLAIVKTNRTLANWGKSAISSHLLKRLQRNQTSMNSFVQLK